jgi:hypothetical protein
MKKYNQSLLINRIVDAIVASDLLEPEKKLLALDDLLLMYKDHYYFNFCEVTKPTGDQSLETWISGHHFWSRSKLGHDFWQKIEMIIGRV